MKKRKRKGISLIVLVITIIVIIILVAMLILTLNKNNPIEEANRARYESDVANIQAVFTNTVSKVMAQNQGTIEINVGELNSVKIVEDGVNSTEGRVNYLINNPQNSENKYGTIIFDVGINNNITYYTGRKLPLYNVGETTWYIDSDGLISLKVNEKEYGKDKIHNIPTEEIDGEEIVESENPMLQAFERNSSIAFHAEEYKSKITKIKFATNVKVPNNKIKAWDISDAKDKSVMAWIEDDGNEGYILTIAGKKKIIANPNSSNLFYEFKKVVEIENLKLLDTSKVTDMSFMFYGNNNVSSIDISNFNTSNVTNMNYMFAYLYKCKNLDLSSFNTSKVNDMYAMFSNSSFDTINISNFDMNKVIYMGNMFYSCRNLRSIGTDKFTITNSANVQQMFSYCENINTIITIKSGISNGVFYKAATNPSAKIILNYTTECESIVDDIILTKENSNIVKGSMIEI